MNISTEETLNQLQEQFPAPTGRELFPKIEDPTEFLNLFSSIRERALAAQVMARMETTMNAKFAEMLKVQHDRNGSPSE